MNLKQKLTLFMATGGCIGYIPIIPGTFGTAAGIPLCYFISKIDSVLIVFTLIAVFIIFSIRIADKAEPLFGKKDPGCIVIDEIAGIIVTMAGLPFNLFSVVAGFTIFRLLDIIKPFPISYLEKKLPGGTGIVMDDVMAGILATLILRAGFAIIG